jgi:hypothetical protein
MVYEMCKMINDKWECRHVYENGSRVH